MKHKSKIQIDRVLILWILCIIVLSVFSVRAVFRLIAVLPKESFEQKIHGSIMREGKWFVKNQLKEGDFRYETYTATGDVKEGNNIVRQAGAMYGLAQVYDYNKDPETRKVLEKGFNYFRGLSATQSAEVIAIRHNDAISTNTTALIVLALVEYLETDERYKTTENLEYLVRLSNYLMSTQTPDGWYANEYKPEPVESDYNNGETMYALIRSYNATKKEAYLRSVKQMAEYAMRTYGTKEFNASFFSWGMAGFAYLYRTTPDEKYWQFLKKYQEKYFHSLGLQYEVRPAKRNTEAIPPGASVFLEGVDHIAWIAKDKDSALYDKLKRHIQKVLNFLLTYEVNSPYGAYTSKIGLVSGAVCGQSDCRTTRIDFMQHNMSAMLLYLRFLK